MMLRQPDHKAKKSWQAALRAFQEEARRLGLKLADRDVFMTLVAHRNEEGNAWPGMELLVAPDMKRRRVEKALVRLQQCGAIRKVQHHGAGRMPTWNVTWPYPSAEAQGVPGDALMEGQDVSGDALPDTRRLRGRGKASPGTPPGKDSMKGAGDAAAQAASGGVAGPRNGTVIDDGAPEANAAASGAADCERRPVVELPPEERAGAIERNRALSAAAFPELRRFPCEGG